MDQIRPNVALPDVHPWAAQRAVVMVGRKWDVVCQVGHDARMPLVEQIAVASTGLPPVVALERTR